MDTVAIKQNIENTDYIKLNTFSLEDTFKHLQKLLYKAGMFTIKSL